MTDRRSFVLACTIAAMSLAFCLPAPAPGFAASENAGLESGMVVAQLSVADSESSATALHRKLSAAGERVERLAAELAAFAPEGAPGAGPAQLRHKVPTKEEVEAYHRDKQLREQLAKLQAELRALKQRNLELLEAAARARAKCQDAKAQLNAVAGSAGVGAAIGGAVGGPFGVPVGAAAGAAVSSAVSPPNPGDLDGCEEAARLDREAGQLDLQSDQLLSEIQRMQERLEAARKRQEERERQQRQTAVTRQDKRPSVLAKRPHAVLKKETAAVGANTSDPPSKEKAKTRPVQAARKPSEQPFDVRQKTGVTQGAGSAMDRLSGAASGGGGGPSAGGAAKARGGSNVAAPASSATGGRDGLAAPATSINRNAIGGGGSPERIR